MSRRFSVGPRGFFFLQTLASAIVGVRFPSHSCLQCNLKERRARVSSSGTGGSASCSLSFFDMDGNSPVCLITGIVADGSDPEDCRCCVFLMTRLQNYLHARGWAHVWSITKLPTRPRTLHCPYGVCLLVGRLTSQQQAGVSQGRICSDNFTCCHTEIQVADPTFHLTQSQYTGTGPTSPSADPITPGAWQGSHWSANF